MSAREITYFEDLDIADCSCPYWQATKICIRFCDFCNSQIIL